MLDRYRFIKIERYEHITITELDSDPEQRITIARSIKINDDSIQRYLAAQGIHIHPHRLAIAAYIIEANPQHISTIREHFDTLPKLLIDLILNEFERREFLEIAWYHGLKRDGFVTATSLLHRFHSKQTRQNS